MNNHVSTFEEIAEQLNNSDCNEVILGIDDQESTYNTGCSLCDLLIIYKKYENVYVFRTMLKGSNYVIIEQEINDAFIKCDYVNDVISMFYLNKLLIFQTDTLYYLLKVMNQNNWTLPQINEWSENPCFK